MRILLIGPSPEGKGGVASVISTLLGFFQEKGIKASAVSTRPSLSENSAQNLASYSKSVLNIVIACIFRSFDIAHIHMASRGSAFRKCIIALILNIFRVPYVIHLHGGEFKKFYLDEIGPLSRHLIRLFMSSASAVIALTPSWKAWLEESIGLANVVVVFNGAPAVGSYLPKRSVPPTILFLGKLSQGKGTDILIKAMLEVVKKCPDAVLELAGDGDVSTYRAQASTLPNNIRFLGWVDSEAKVEAFRRATLLCLPSWNEGLPMSILEAMSVGLPVIVTPVGGIPEVVLNEVNGFLVEPGDAYALAEALIKVISNAELAQAMGANGRCIYQERFSSIAMGSACLSLYKNCLSK
ncbi:glycosyltransferase family 4 protein [Stutzerimonas xanthomarina]|uniref:glycosyltransferase family 4 protein n=1 Tax=Stutzerimonas xanthomarina TaxID=271420 RepID=UPI003AA9A1B9